MNIILNGEAFEARDGITLLELMVDLGVEKNTMATTINTEIVKKTQWGTTIIKENDQIELLQFMGGG